MLIHIGLHKTGTTWLQQVFFRHHPEFFSPFELAAILEHLVFPHTLDFDTQHTRDVFTCPESGDQVPVLSAERLSGNPHSGGYDSGILAERLAAVFPSAKILIVIREQATMLDSLYRQYAKIGGVCSPQDYLDPVRDGRMPLFRPEYLAYHRLVGLYHQLFGKAQVLVLPYEYLKDNPAGFTDSICEFAGVSNWYPQQLRDRVAPSHGDLVTLTKAHLNRWHGGDSLYPVTPRLPWASGFVLRQLDRLNQVRWASQLDLGLNEFCKSFAAGRYETSNQQLQQMVDFSLAEYGYALPA